ncbi:PREDICTED: uncharacterized protein LOC106819727 [Priapulus caudatus]|uniref:Uncharacterized protein LOC106819727 n=1 Tax=Priapulus caudatus TaxID=37621 RepID=A0ABM1F5T9_PRICU|nr:PREDICTED: uncharacterized protein LOC106819727 [Priapulus caudatus]
MAQQQCHQVGRGHPSVLGDEIFMQVGVVLEELLNKIEQSGEGALDLCLLRMQRLQQIMQCAKRVLNIPQDIIDLIDKAIVLSINIQELHTALPLMPAKTVHDGGRHRPTYDIAEEQLRQGHKYCQVFCIWMQAH